MTKHAFECGCWSEEHLMVVDVDTSINYRELTFHLQLNHYLPWYSRLLEAFKYVFGLTNSRYHWGDCMLSEEAASRLSTILIDYVVSGVQ